MLKKEDFFWQEHKTNNIETNPLQEWYCIIDTQTAARKYSIVPQYPSEDGLIIDTTKDPECYVLFEATGQKATEEDKKKLFYNSCNFDGYLFKDEAFIRAFKTLEQAKERAYEQYKAIYGYVLSYIVDDTEEATKSHFCVKGDSPCKN